jgi:8-oxo-dGTP diphosphatase
MMSQQSRQHVVAGVITNTRGQILLALRPKHVHQGGLWEFPGGKCEPGESAEKALARELQEELDLIVQQARPLIRVTYNYSEKAVLLDVWQVERWRGHIWGREGQIVSWNSLNELKSKQFPLANYPILTAIRLPNEYLITPEPTSFKDFFYHLESRLADNFRLIQLRAKNLSERDYCHWAEKALTLCERYQAQLLVNADPKIANSVGAHGVHLTSQRLLALSERPLSTQLWVAASCHTVEEIQQANRLGVDFLVLSPLKKTLSHPIANPLGWLNFFQLTEQTNCPTFALGGMKREDMVKAWAHGAQGIAAIRAWW